MSVGSEKCLSTPLVRHKRVRVHGDQIFGPVGCTLRFTLSWFADLSAHLPTHPPSVRMP